MRIATLSTCTSQGLGATHAKGWGLARAGKQKGHLGHSGCVGREFPEDHTGVAMTVQGPYNSCSEARPRHNCREFYKGRHYSVCGKDQDEQAQIGVWGDDCEAPEQPAGIGQVCCFILQSQNVGPNPGSSLCTVKVPIWSKHTSKKKIKGPEQ